MDLETYIQRSKVRVSYLLPSDRLFAFVKRKKRRKRDVQCKVFKHFEA